MVNKRQATILVIICALAAKLQRLPSLVSYTVGRDGYIVFFMLGLFDVLFLMLAIWFFNRNNNKGTLKDVLDNSYGTAVSRILLFMLFCYFMIIAILPSVAIRDLFANILFDQINYNYFGLIFLFVIIFMAVKGLQTLGRQGEIYVGILAFSVIGVLLLGLSSTRLERILPVLDIDYEILIGEMLRDTLWFGDYMILYFLTGQVSLKKNEKLGAGIVIPYAVVVLIIIPVAYVVFYTIYNNLAGFQTNAISSLTQFSLLTLDIGRIDWFLVLFEQISTILASSIYILIASTCFCQAFSIKKPMIPIIIFATAIFVVDLFVFSNINTSMPQYRQFFYIYSMIVIYLLPFVFTIASLIFQKKLNKNEIKKPKNIKKGATNNVSLAKSKKEAMND